MSVRDLVVRPGGRVSASGRYVARADGDWLDMAGTGDLIQHPQDWMSNHSVQLLGLNQAAIPTAWGPENAIMPGRVRVTGVWDGKATISVEKQTPVERDWKRRHFHIPCPPPDGGWDPAPTADDPHEVPEVPELETLRASGAIALDIWVHEPGGAHVLIVAATDVELVRSVLGPRLTRRLCIIASRYSAAHVREVEDVLHSRFRDWGLQSSRPHGLADDGQPHAEASLVRVTDELATWADNLPDGLLELHPVMTPA